MNQTGILIAAVALAAVLGGFLAARLLVARWPMRWLRARPRGRLDEADCFAVFGFGLGRDANGHETAGGSNEALARWLLDHNPQRKPTFVQEGVYLALAALEKKRPDLMLANWVFRLSHDPEAYATTGDAALQCWELATLRGLSRPVVVAHDLHLRRMAWLFAAAFGEDRVVVPEMPEVPFDAKSVQHWGTRSRGGWVVWEVLLARPATGRFGGLFLFALGVLLGAVSAGAAAFAAGRLLIR